MVEELGADREQREGVVLVFLGEEGREDGYLVVEEANRSLVDRQGQHLHERDVLGDDILVAKVQGCCDDRVDVVVREDEDYRISRKG